jgi:predicted DNA-binding antitoxin AbrB/MazE fold protein
LYYYLCEYAPPKINDLQTFPEFSVSYIILLNQEVRMTTQTLDAVFNNGVFRPITPQEVSIDEGQKVRLSVETTPLFDDLSDNKILKLAASVYEGLSEQQIDEIEKIALNRSPFEKG